MRGDSRLCDVERKCGHEGSEKVSSFRSTTGTAIRSGVRRYPQGRGAAKLKNAGG